MNCAAEVMVYKNWGDEFAAEEIRSSRRSDPGLHEGLVSLAYQGVSC